MGDASIGARIPKLKKKRIEKLVKKGIFKSQAAFLRMAVDRLLEEIEEVRLAQRKEAKKAREGERSLEEEQKQAMREIVDFVDDL